MAGEGQHQTGLEGVRRAKEWLERTGRVNVHWTVYEHAPLLTVKRPAGGDRSFDIGGVLRGGDLDGRMFYAEVKKYSDAGGQASMYGDYLANCYCMTRESPEKPLEFMWITWHPFSLTKWSKLTDWEEIRDSVQARQAEWLGELGVDEEVCKLAASRLWLVVLSDRQEQLTMSDEMLAELEKQARLGTKR